MVRVASFLSPSEADKIKSALTDRNIDYFVSSKGHVPGSFNDQYYQLSVDAINYLTVRRIVTKIIANRFIESKKCPKCKTLGYRIIEKKNLWDKFYYFGTTRVQCKKCKTLYVI